MREIDQTALTRYRLERLRAELRKRDFAGAVLSDPMNLRYATGTRMNFLAPFESLTANGTATTTDGSGDFKTIQMAIDHAPIR